MAFEHAGGDANVPSKLDNASEAAAEQKGIQFGDVITQVGDRVGAAAAAIQGDVSKANTALVNVPELGKLTAMVERGEQVVAARGEMSPAELQVAVKNNEALTAQVQQFVGNTTASIEDHSSKTGLA